MITDLRLALDPTSIAIIGASDNRDKIGGRPIHYLAKFGFRGRVYPVNPSRAEVQGVRCFSSIGDLPEVPDMAIIAIPGEEARIAIEQCSIAGVKFAILMASGFGETDNGKAAERALAARARAHGMRIIGPNSQGLANFATGAVASFSTMFTEAPPEDGPVGIVSQSGAMSVVPYGILRGRGVGVRHAHATGNDCDVTVAELACAVAQDRDVRLLLLYLESIEDPTNLALLARIAHERALPILALKPGRTPEGQVAARSHTGALANEDRVVDAFLERYGIRRVQDTAEMLDAVELYLKGWQPTGRRLVIISNSGATCVMAADAAAKAGMTLSVLGTETLAGLRAVLPSFAATTNPIDITAALLSNSRLFSEILPVIATDPTADNYFIGVPVAGAAYDVPAFARDAAAFGTATGKPLVIAAPQPSVAMQFKAAGLAVFPFETQAIFALEGFVKHHALMERAGSIEPPPIQGQAVETTLAAANEAESLAMLAGAGVPVVPHAICQTEAEIEAAYGAYGPTVVVKGCSADVTHKSEYDLVRLNLTDRDAVIAAFRDCRRIMLDRGFRFDGVLLAPMRRGRRELLIGAHRDPVFGPVVLVGDGGKYVEAAPDTSLLLPPFTMFDAAGALDRLRVAPILRGVRGEPTLDTTSFCHAAVSVGRLMLEDGSIHSLDINPMLIDETGCVALDAIILRRACEVSAESRVVGDAKLAG